MLISIFWQEKIDLRRVFRCVCNVFKYKNIANMGSDPNTHKLTRSTANGLGRITKGTLSGIGHVTDIVSTNIGGVIEIVSWPIIHGLIDPWRSDPGNITNRPSLPEEYRIDANGNRVRNTGSSLSEFALPGAGNFPGPGWGNNVTPKTRPVDMWDLAGKIHDFNYHINDLSWGLGNALMNLSDGWKTRSRKAKSDYIFRKMTFGQHQDPWTIMWGVGANISFDGATPANFRKNDCFDNALVRKELDNENKYLMIPYIKLSAPKSNGQYNNIHAMDINPGWKNWKVKNVPYWSHLSKIDAQTGR